ncbi:hypothetical protein [Vibrio gallaecicus]|uniref:hypothetical protein n=1 Tax=Vibrio gallaecicus TaxID=552386 RepID=UPI0025B34E9D|nr:hypothetical protein [Vibrio gallaecicus]MDN3617200.1 hypothetical protein [Vibrio gallaecicus]
MDISEIINLYGGIPAIVTTLNVAVYTIYLMYKKNELQKLKDIEVNEIKIKLDKTLSKIAHVDQSRFDKEFQIYQEIWESLTNLNMEAEKLKYILKFGDNLEEKDKRILDFFNSNLSTSSIIYKHTPFYPEEIHTITTTILSELQSYAENVSRIREDEKLLSWASDHNRVFAKKHYNELEKAIKNGLDTLSSVAKNV